MSETTQGKSTDPKPDAPTGTQDGSNGPATPAAAIPADEQPPKDRIRQITRVVVAVAVLYFVWYVLADRYTPYTDQARVQALITPIVPRVSGYLTQVNVRLHSQVQAGDLLFQIDPRPYVLAVRSAEANLDLAAQQVGAQAETVKSAASQLSVARAQLDRAQRNYNRTRDILANNPGALSQADRDRAETSLDQGLARVSTAEAELQRAKEQLGAEGPENPQLRAAVAALENAQLNLAFTDMHAPYAGAIESFNVDVGFYAAAAQPIATFVSNNDIWIRADMRENNISNIEVGDPVEFVLDVAPGRVFQGQVRSVGFGVSTESSGTNRGELPNAATSQGWLREPQRIPVILDLDRRETQGLLRSGGQADLVVYTGDRPILNAISRVRIRLKSLISYVR